MAFERILQVFDDFRKHDPLYEAVSASYGYTLLAWEPRRGSGDECTMPAASESLYVFQILTVAEQTQSALCSFYCKGRA